MDMNKINTFILLTFLTLGIFGCKSNEPSVEETAKIRAISDQVSDMLLGKFKSRLIGAVRESGTAGAIRVEISKE
jgi:hypothetical protein